MSVLVYSVEAINKLLKQINDDFQSELKRAEAQIVNSFGIPPAELTKHHSEYQGTETLISALDESSNVSNVNSDLSALHPQAGSVQQVGDQTFVHDGQGNRYEVVTRTPSELDLARLRAFGVAGKLPEQELNGNGSLIVQNPRHHTIVRKLL